jgi:Short C-terminal domain
MSNARVATRIAIVVSVLTLIVAVVGFVITLMLNIFMLDKYNVYGEVPIPGSGTLQLPAGEVTVSFHTEVIGSPSGGGLPVPQLGMRIDPPAGVPDPKVTESYGGTTTINNNAHVRVWVVQVPAAGSYAIKTEGQVNGYIAPRLAFGHKSPYGSLVWAFVVLFGIGLLNLICALWWWARTRSSRLPSAAAGAQPAVSPVFTATPVHLAADQGVKLEQLKTLTSLRDSGALTEAEFEAEKRRILDGR